MPVAGNVGWSTMWLSPGVRLRARYARLSVCVSRETRSWRRCGHAGRGSLAAGRPLPPIWNVLAIGIRNHRRCGVAKCWHGTCWSGVSCRSRRRHAGCRRGLLRSSLATVSCRSWPRRLRSCWRGVIRSGFVMSCRRRLPGSWTGFVDRLRRARWLRLRARWLRLVLSTSARRSRRVRHGLDGLSLPRCVRARIGVCCRLLS